MRVLIVGCGYVGVPLGRQLHAAGHQVVGVRRSPEADDLLVQHGITPLHADISRSAELRRIAPEFDAVILLVSSSRGGLAEYQEVYLNGTRNLIEWLRPNPPARFVYTSSTSVYGQTDGSWVTEQSAAAPESPTSQILVQAERLLLQAWRDSGLPVTISRVAGIYGPGRGYWFQQFLRGEATMRDGGSAWLNMVHVDDVAASIIHLLDRGAAGEIYNVVDDEPVRQGTFFAWLSEQLGKPMPPSAPAQGSRKRGVTNKRVSNEKLRATGYRLIYPTFREGYSAELRRLGLRPDSRFGLNE